MGDNRLGAIKVLRAIGSLLQLSCASAGEVVKCWGAKLGVGGTQGFCLKYGSFPVQQEASYGSLLQLFVRWRVVDFSGLSTG